ncbi:hypothetical protein C8R46DRAFT_1194138 [Mycena filopes]|nr:hypothetical protein C8R46DRAFT_1194138 [Mycena filopes]
MVPPPRTEESGVIPVLKLKLPAVVAEITINSRLFSPQVDEVAQLFAGFYPPTITCNKTDSLARTSTKTLPKSRKCAHGQTLRVQGLINLRDGEPYHRKGGGKSWLPGPLCTAVLVTLEGFQEVAGQKEITINSRLFSPQVDEVAQLFAGFYPPTITCNKTDSLARTSTKTLPKSRKCAHGQTLRVQGLINLRDGEPYHRKGGGKSWLPGPLCTAVLVTLEGFQEVAGQKVDDIML